MDFKMAHVVKSGALQAQSGALYPDEDPSRFLRGPLDRVYDELAVYDPVGAIRKFNNADARYKNTITSSFNGSFEEFVDSYMVSIMHQFQRGDYTALYKKGKRKDLDSREKQIIILDELDRDRLRISGVEAKERIESAFGYSFKSFQVWFNKSLSR